MASRHLVHPELTPGLEMFPGGLDLSHETLPALRQGFQPPPPPEVPDITIREQRIPGPAGAPELRVVIYAPAKAEGPRPAILHVHGGGYVMGAPEGSDVTNRLQASALSCVIVSVDYRLAPDTPFPGPLEDCYAGLKWLHENAEALRVDRTRIAVKGESAGGGLAAGLALLARDRGEVPVLIQVLTYPMIDDRAAAEPHPYTGEFVWTAENNAFGWRCYLGQEPGAPGISPYAAPARAEDLRGLPPAFIATGALDLFLEEDMEYARRLARAGVPVEMHVYPGAYHGFPVAGETSVSRRYEHDCREALRAAFARS